MISNRKAVLSWCFYDWANSAFAVTVMAGFFPVFFKSYWCVGTEATVSTARLGFANAIAGLIVAVLSPFLGALADSSRSKKKLLMFFVLLGTTTSGLLFFIQKGDWFSALVIFIVACIGYNSANLFYDSLIVNIVEKENMDVVSSMGYSLGYLGCGLLLLLNVFMVQKPAMFGLADAAAAVKTSFMMTSIWWLVFSIPLFLFVREPVYDTLSGILAIISETIHRLKKTSLKILHTRSLLLFFLAFWLYIDGVHTFVLMAIDFGMSIGISSSSLMIALLAVQFVAFPSALVFGLLSRKFGAFSMIMAGIIIYILVSVIGSLTLKTQLGYIILAGVSGIAQGGIQALSRSYFGKIIPPEESAEYFGFYNVVGRFAVIIGPAIVGTVALLTRKAGLESTLASRIGMSSVGLLFLAGGTILLFVDKRNWLKK